MIKIHNFLILFIVGFILFGCATISYNDFYETLDKSKLIVREDEPVFNSDDIEDLIKLQQEEFELELTKQLEFKRFVDPWTFKQHQEYDYLDIIGKLALNFPLNMNVYNKLYKNPSSVIIEALFQGQYKFYYLMIKKNFINKIEKKKFKNFIYSLPDDKMCVLALFNYTKMFVKNVSPSSFDIAYKNIRRDNYKEILKQTEYFKLFVKEPEEVLTTFSYYYKLFDLLDELEANTEMNQ